MTDLMPLQGYHHIEFWVGNAKQAMHYYRTSFGFRPIAYAGPETGVRDRASWVLAQGDIRFVVTAGLGPESPVVQHAALHGDGVKDIAFRVPDAEDALRVAVERGAQSVEVRRPGEDEHGKVVTTRIAAYGETTHSFVDDSNYSGIFLPGYVAVEQLPRIGAYEAEPVGLEVVDHLVANVELGAMDTWVRWYSDVMGFTQLVHYDDAAISTEYSALMSKVLWDGEGRVKLPINEPAAGKKKSQIEEYLDYYRSPGVQHLALSTNDIVATVRQLRDNGVRFMRVPSTYYADVRARLDWSAIDADLAALEEQNILIDTDDEGYLLQIFTEPVQDRPTVFYEVIERHGSRGFGEGNFKALFEAIERDQAARGNL
jgi:4-hydroxyphenylpyruvate dioxygenase